MTLSEAITAVSEAATGYANVSNELSNAEDTVNRLTAALPIAKDRVADCKQRQQNAVTTLADATAALNQIVAGLDQVHT